MGRKRDEETGRYTTHYEEEDFLAVLESEEFLSTDEVAEAIGCTQNLAYRRLKELEDDGKVSSRRIGRSLAWQLSEETN